MGSRAILINWGSSTWGQADSVLTFPCASLGWTVTWPKASNRETGAEIPYRRPLHFLIPQELSIREVWGPCEAPGTVVLRGAYSTIFSHVIKPPSFYKHRWRKATSHDPFSLGHLVPTCSFCPRRLSWYCSFIFPLPFQVSPEHQQIFGNFH